MVPSPARLLFLLAATPAFTGLVAALFVPEQLPTLLSFLYSNIPPIRKGHDSRVGLGFRVGQNADFQMQFEIGPQESTLPLGQTDAAKRQVPNRPWIQRWRGEVQRPGEILVGGAGSGDVLLDRDVVNHLRQLYNPRQ